MISSLVWVSLASASRHFERTWWAPASLFALIFSLESIGTTLLAPEYVTSPKAEFVLQIFGLALLLGSRIGQAVPRGNRDPLACKVERFTVFLVSGYVGALVSLISTLRVVGAGFSALTSSATLSALAQSSTKTRYTAGFDFPVYYNVANALVIAYAILVTMHWVATRKVRLVSAGPLMIYCLGNLLITTRAPILFLLMIMGFSMVFAEREVSGSGEFPALFSGRYFARIVLSGSFITGLFFYFQVLRFGKDHAQSSGAIWAHLRRYPWGSLPGFSAWRSGQAGYTPPHHPGYYTFMGVFDNLGIEPRTEGGFTDYINLAPGEPGNVYTAYRGLILDFGLSGALIFMLILGLAGGLACNRGALPPSLSCAAFLAVSCFICWSIVFSFWSYTSNLLALFCIPLVHKWLTSRSGDVGVGKVEVRG